MWTHYRRAVLHAARHGFKLGRPLQNPEALLRVAVAVVVATVVSYFLNNPMVTIGAWFTGMGSLVPRRRNRVAISAVSTLLLCVAGPLVGVHLHGTPWLLYVLAFLGTFVGGMLLTLGIGPGMRVIIMMIMMVAFADISPDISTGLSEVKWLAVGGGIGFVCHLIPPYGPRFEGQRDAVAALYDALAADARAYADGGAPGQPWPQPTLTARQALTVLPQRSRAAAAPLFALVGEAERIVRYLRALEAPTGLDPDTRKARCAAVADVLSEIASAVRTGRTVAATTDERARRRLEPRPGEPPARTLRGLVESLTEAERIASLSDSGDAGASWQHTELAKQHAQSGFLARGLRQLRAELAWESPAFRHALRLAVAATLAEAVGRASGDWGGIGVAHHAVWAFLTAAVVLVPTFEHTIGRGISRSAGAVVGGFLGWGLTMLPDDRLLHSVIVVLLIFGYLAFRSMGQPPTIICITAVVAYIGGEGASAWSRTVDTLIGASIAMIVYVLWPTWHSKRLPRLLGDWTRIEGRYLGTLAAAWADPAGADRAALDRMGHEARVARRHFQEAAAEATSEPVHHRARWSGPELETLSRSTRELAKGSALLAAHAPGPRQPGVPSAARYADSLQEELSELAEAAETGRMPAPGLTAELHDLLSVELADTTPSGMYEREVFAHVTHAVEDLASAISDQRVTGRHRAVGVG
ncbi:FUSC family protein [Streptomyces krungchingensis]